MIEQVFIAVTELIAIWLVQDRREEYRKFAPIFGLLGQPFWFFSSFQAQQWGAFILCFFFTAAWIKSLGYYWLSDKQAKLNADQYYDLISSALDHLDQKTKLDYKDYIRRVLKEALSIK